MNECNVESTQYCGMGTVISSKVYGAYANEALAAAKQEAIRLEGLLSRFIPHSDISRINSSAGISYERVANITYKVLATAVEFSKNCQGCFDVTIGPLMNLWSYYKQRHKTPSKIIIDKFLNLIDYADIELDANNNAVFLKRKGQSLDLGAIGKGYAADLILEVIKEYSITSAFFNIGGNVATIGAKPDGSRWNVGIRHPRKANGLLGVVSIVNKSVVTSGDYERYYIAGDGRRYHHIINPTTGYPADSGLISVTIVADSSMVADVLSTAVFVAGLEKGLDIIKKYSGIEAIMIDNDLKIYITKGLIKYFSVFEKTEVCILD